METVVIRWHGPYKVEQVEDVGVATMFGIYAVYRNWGGSNKLYYIGETYARRKDFWARLTDHRRKLHEVRGSKTVHFGVVELESGQKHSERRNKDAEALLIWWHRPPGNKKSINTYRGRELEVINIGRRGDIERRVRSSDANDHE